MSQAKATAKVRAKAKAKVRAKVRAKIKAKATAKAKAKATAKAKLAPSGCTLPLSKLSRPQNWRRCRRRQLLRPRQSTRSSRRGRGTRSKVADQSLYLECENTGGRHSQFAICLGRVRFLKARLKIGNICLWRLTLGYRLPQKGAVVSLEVPRYYIKITPSKRAIGL